MAVGGFGPFIWRLVQGSLQHTCAVYDATGCVTKVISRCLESSRAFDVVFGFWMACLLGGTEGAGGLGCFVLGCHVGLSYAACSQA